MQSAAQQAEELASVESRRHQRSSVLWTARMQHGLETRDCLVLNISSGGAKLRLSEPPPKGSAVKLDIERVGEFSAEVMWSRGDTAGVRFAASPREVARLILGRLIGLAQ